MLMTAEENQSLSHCLQPFGPEKLISFQCEQAVSYSKGKSFQLTVMCVREKMAAYFSDISSNGGAVPSVPVKSPPAPGFCSRSSSFLRDRTCFRTNHC